MAYEEAEQEYFRREAYEEFAEEKDSDGETQDNNDVICTAAGGVSMRLFYMCCLLYTSDAADE